MAEENTNNAQKEETISSKELLGEVVKTNRQEVVETLRYPGIKLVSRFAKMFGVIFAIIFFILAFVSLFVGEGGFLGKMLLFLQYMAWINALVYCGVLSGRPTASTGRY